MADQWPDHPSVGGNDAWPDHPAASQQFFPNTEVRADNRTYEGAPSMAPGFLSGLASLPAGAAQFLAHGAASMFPSAQPAAKATDAAVKYLADPGTQDPGLYGAGRTAGSIAGTAALTPLLPLGAGGALARTGAGLATGAGIGAATPVENPDQDFWKQKLAQTEMGGAVGGAIPAIGGAARALLPGPTSAMQTLRAAGIEPNPGATMGGLPAVTENLLGKFPIVGPQIQAGRTRAMGQLNDALATKNVDFNRDVINQKALAPIGEALSPDTAVGHPMVAEAADKLSKAYQAAIPAAGGKVDQQLLDDLANLSGNAKLSLPGDAARRFEDRLQQHVLNRVDNNGAMSGQAFKDAETDLGQASREQFAGNSSPDDRKLGRALQQAQGAVRDWLGRVSPENADAIQAANEGWKALLRVQNAAGRAGNNGGEFTPQQLLAATKKYAASGQFERGNAFMQDMAQNAMLDRNALMSAGKQGLQSPSATGHDAGVGISVVAAEHLLEHPTMGTALALGAAYPTLGALYSNAGRSIANRMTVGGRGLLNLPISPLAAQIAARHGGLLSQFTPGATD